MRHNKIWLLDDLTMQKLNSIQKQNGIKNKDDLLNYMADIVIKCQDKENKKEKKWQNSKIYY